MSGTVPFGGAQTGATTAGVTAIPVIWFDGTSSRRHQARLHSNGDDVWLVTNDATGNADANPAHIRKAAVRVGSRVGDAPYSLSFPGGGLALCADHIAVEKLFQLDAQRRWISRMERAGAVVAIALAGLIAALVFSYQSLIPLLAEFVAQRIPRESERHLGEVALKAMDRYGFKSSRLDGAWQMRIRADFDRLAAVADLSTITRLEFRKHSPNAFALPGGTVILTDDLVHTLKDDHEALLAVLAHEIGHQAHRDTLRHLLSGSISAVLVAAVTGDISGVAAVTTAIPSIAYALKFSRSVEAEADDYAFDLLRRAGHTPAAFARAMERIRAVQLCKMLRMKDRADAGRAPGPMYDLDADDPASLSQSSSTPERPPAKCISDPEAYLRGREKDYAKIDLSGGVLSYVSTHPADEDRIARARAARQ